MHPTSIPHRRKADRNRLFPRLALKAFLLLGLIGGSLIPMTTALAADSADEDADRLCVMTFNLRYANDTPPNAWPDRRPVVKECIEAYAPDLIGTQEGVYNQLKDIDADLPDYAWIGLGRNGGSHGEFMAVFYRKERFEPLKFDHYWLSDTPLVIASATWDHNNRRMVTWVKFLDRQTGRTFYFINTHFDHAVEQARVNAAHLVLKKIEDFDPDLPILLVGDFNAPAGNSEPFDILVNRSDFVDTRDAAKIRRGESLNTFHGYQKGSHDDGRRIDWILSRGPVVSEANEIITFSKNGQHPSDHFPVATWLRIQD